MRTKRQLAIELSKLKVFDNPDSWSEQYPTDSEVAADLLWTCYMNNNLTTVADLGAGTGILSLGACLLGAEKVYHVEQDSKAIAIAKENQKYLEDAYDVELPIVYVNKPISLFHEKVNTVIENPPFGVQKEHADREFLEKAFLLADNIYTLHKIESEQFIKSFSKDKGFYVLESKEYSFPIKQTMQHHKQKIKRIKVGLWILKKE